MGGGYASAKSVLVCGSCGLVTNRLVYKLASEPGPRPRLSAKRVCMYGNATPAVLGSAGNRGMAGGLSGNATREGLGRARNKGVAGGVNGDATPAGLGTARSRGVGGVNGNATPAGLGTARKRGVAGGMNVSSTPAGLGMARNRGVAGGFGPMLRYRYTMFFLIFPRVGSSRPRRKTDLKKTKLLLDETIPLPGYTMINH